MSLQGGVTALQGVPHATRPIHGEPRRVFSLFLSHWTVGRVYVIRFQPLQSVCRVFIYKDTGSSPTSQWG